LIDARRLALMKRGALLINVARATIVDEDALYATLKDGYSADLPSRGGEPIALCRRGRVIAHPTPDSFCLAQLPRF
jgi:hypothetical protein